jgi:tripartite-type tricarboxylate transporter receptor subunit TctC
MIQESRGGARRRMHAGARIAALVACATTGTGAIAQDYPVRPVRLIVASTAGSAPDILARIVGQKLNDAWGQPVVVDNRAGGSGTIGAQTLAAAVPDGHTLLMATVIVATLQATMRKPGYDAHRDFQPVSRVAAVPLILVVHPSMAATDVAGLIAIAKAKPGQLNFASPGAGSLQHLVAESFQKVAGLRMVHIPYKSGNLGVTAVMGGEAQLFFAGLPPALPQVRAGKLRALAVTTAKRFGSTPTVPTMAEAGLPGFEADNWHGILAPARTPPAVVRKLHAAIDQMTRQPDVQARFLDAGGEAQSSTPEAFTAEIRADVARWTKIAAELGIRLD